MLNVFRTRAKMARRFAYGLLAFIVVLLVVGATAFVRAPEITRADTASDLNLDKHIAQIAEERSKLSSVVGENNKKLREEQDNYTQQYNERDLAVRLALNSLSTTARKYGPMVFWHNETPDDGRPSDLKVDETLLTEHRLIPSLKHLLVGIPADQTIRLEFSTVIQNRFVDLSQTAFDLFVSELEKTALPAIPAMPRPLPVPVPSGAEQRLILLEKALQKLTDEKTNRAVESLTGLDTGSNASNAELDAFLKKGPLKAELPLIDIIQTNITRVGLIVMLTFLVSILTQLYRYNIRLATFYDGRADILELSAGLFEQASLAQLSATLTPSFDFGKSLATPVEQILQVFRLNKDEQS